MGNVWAAALADMELTSTFNKRFCFLLYVIDNYSKYAWASLLKVTKAVAITNDFEKFLDEPNCKPIKIWVDKGSEFYNRSMKSLLQDIDVKMYSTYN